MESKVVTEKKAGFIARELTHNKEVTARLEAITEDFESAKTTEALITALKSYPEDFDLTYKNTIAWVVGSIGALALAGVILMMVNGLSGWLAVGLCVVALLPFIFVAVYLNKNVKRERLLSQLFNRYEEIKYGFTYMGDQKNISFEENKALYANAFARGNYRNNIPKYASGVTEFDGKELNYTLFEYVFANRTRRTKKVKRKTVSYYVYDYFTQWGLFVSDVKVPAFSISNFTKKYYPETWTTADDRFNQAYNISADSEIEIAKLMQPANVLMFEKVLGSLPGEPGRLRTKTNSKGDVSNYHPPLQTTEIVGSRETPSLYWNINLNIFKRSSAEVPTFKNPGILAEYIESIKLENFDQLFEAIQPLFKKVVK